MKIHIDDELIHEITEFDLKVLATDIDIAELPKILKDRVKWDVQSYCEESYEKLKNKWLPILFTRLKQIPTDKQELLQVIMSQPDYKDAYLKRMEAKAKAELAFKVN